MGQVRKLAIVAHGDKNGVVQLERNLTADTAMSFKSEFLALSRFMVDFGRLIFFSCIAGGDDPGTQLLNTLSAQCLPGRHVIGFEKFGSIGRYGSENAPGAIFAAQSPPPSPLDLIVADSTQASGCRSIRGTRSGPSTDGSFGARWAISQRQPRYRA
jgi:hypothetical protein